MSEVYIPSIPEWYCRLQSQRTLLLVQSASAHPGTAATLQSFARATNPWLRKGWISDNTCFLSTGTAKSLMVVLEGTSLLSDTSAVVLFGLFQSLLHTTSAVDVGEQLQNFAKNIFGGPAWGTSRVPWFHFWEWVLMPTPTLVDIPFLKCTRPQGFVSASCLRSCYRGWAVFGRRNLSWYSVFRTWCSGVRMPVSI